MLLSQVPTDVLRERFLYSQLARQDLLAFAQFTSPMPHAPLDVRQSRYEVCPHHELIARHLMAVERGDIRRLIVALPPRHGKTELAVRKFIPWFMGRNPDKSVICATYSDTFSADHGRSVRDLLQAGEYRVCFDSPAYLRQDSQATDRLQTAAGGLAVFVGRGGSLTGRGGDLIVLDDPIKDSEEAQSTLIRDKLWKWYAEVLLTRLMTSEGRVVLVNTRWHEDDLTGRLIDPRNPHYNPAEANRWVVLRIPALAEDNDPLGRQPGQALWPERFPTTHLLEMKELSAQSFSALWQGRPTPEEGTFFKRQWFKFYQPGDLPAVLTRYCSSDHAVSTKQENDRTCLLSAGVDAEGDIWILPNLWWDRKPADTIVDAIVETIRRERPLFWFAETEHIYKSIGPFLRTRMLEERVHAAIVEVSPVKDKLTRAQSFQGRAAMGKVHLPAFAPWIEDALDELLKFPLGAHDDFVDACSNIGLGLDSIQQPTLPEPRKDWRPKPGTLAWIKANASEMQRLEQLEKGNRGM